MSFLRILSAIVALVVCFAGCNPPAETETSNTTDTSVEPATSSDAQDDETAAKDDEADEAPATDAQEEPETDAAPSDEAAKDKAAGDESDVSLNPAENAPADEPAPEPKEQASIKVQLGGDELTGGISGDGRLTVEQIKAWLEEPANHATLEVVLPKGLAAAASSVYIPEDNPLTKAKIELGRQLYFDKRLSVDATVSCADCHHPDEGYARHTQFGVGVDGQEGNRNSPVSYNRIVSRLQFWDGRADSLEAQAVGPIANPIEMGNTHEKAVATITAIEGYKLQFDEIFGDSVTIDNIGKAIAAFERAIVTGPSAYDFYEPLRSFETAFADDLEDLDALKEEEPAVYDQYQALVKAAEAKPMSDSARRGRELFFTDRGSCTACHSGANFTDEKYHNLGVGMDVENPDLGRYAETQIEKDKGAFKTPTVRNVVYSAPYMHDGSVKTLEEVVELYNKGGHANPHLSDKVKKLNLKESEKADLVAFMKACTGDFPKVETGRLPQ